MISTNILNILNDDIKIFKNIHTGEYLIRYYTKPEFGSFEEFVDEISSNIGKVLLSNSKFGRKNKNKNDYKKLRLAVISRGNRSSILSQLGISRLRRIFTKNNDIIVNLISSANILVYKKKYFVSLEDENDLLKFTLLSSNKLIYKFNEIKGYSEILESWYTNKNKEYILDTHLPEIEYSNRFKVNKMLLTVERLSSHDLEIKVLDENVTKRKLSMDFVDLVLVEEV
jgi:hypothetical protein